MHTDSFALFVPCFFVDDLTLGGRMNRYAMKPLGEYKQVRLWVSLIFWSVLVGTIFGVVSLLIGVTNFGILGLVIGVIIGGTFPVIIKKNEQWFLKDSATRLGKK